MKETRKSIVSGRGAEVSDSLRAVADASRATKVNGTAHLLPNNFNNMFTPAKELPSHIKTIKVDVKTWNTLKNLKKENETFEEVIKDLLNERTREMGNQNFDLIKYKRKTRFLETEYQIKYIGAEFEYNDVKGQQSNFILDLKIKKIFYGKRTFNPSFFFGVDSQKKHLSPIYLNLYLKCIALALEKEFGISSRSFFYATAFQEIALWRKIYYDYNLSEESFVNDIEEPCRLSEEEKPTPEEKKNIEKSGAFAIWGWYLK